MSVVPSGPVPGAVVPSAPVPDARAMPARSSRWRRLYPLRLVPGAIFGKEVRAQGRRWGTYLARGLYGAVLLALMSIIFAAFSMESRSRNDARALQEFQTLAPGMTVAVLWFQYVCLTLIAPMLLGPAVCDERRSGTLATLLTTPLTAGQIILGKLAGGLVQIFILALVATPMLLVIRVFGGVQASTIIAGLCVGFSMAVLAACLALLASVTAKRGTTAAVAGLILALALHGIPPIVMGLMRGKMNIMVPHEFIFGSSSPCQMFLVTVELLAGGPWMPVRGGWMWLWNSLYSLALAAMALTWATTRLRRVMLLEGAGAPSPSPSALPTAPPADPAAKAPSMTARRPAHSPAPSGARERAGREVGDRPVLWREVRQPIFRRRWHLPVLVTAIAGLLIWIYAELGVGDREIFIAISAVGMVAAILFAASMPVGAVTGEREARTWETLLTTPLSGREILVGKVAGALRRQWPLPALLCTNFLLAGVLTGVLHPLFLFHYALIIVSPIFFLACTGVLASLVVRRGVQAAVLNAGVALVLWAGIPVLYAIFDGFAPRALRGLRDAFEFFMGVINPVVMGVTAAEGGSTRLVSTPDRPWLRYNLPGTGRIGATLFTGMVVLYSAAFVGLGCGALALASKIFRRSAGRATA